MFAWFNSIVAFLWIKLSLHRWKTCVSNSVSLIQEKISPSCWNYFNKKNPSNCASRLPNEFLHHLWWSGPTWLKLPSNQWARYEILESNMGYDDERVLSHANFVEPANTEFF